VAQAAGIAMAEAVASGCEVVEYSPNQVKQAVAGVGGATKDQMERMVQTLLGIDRPLRPVDAADAVAIALCHLAHAPMSARVAAAQGSAR
jgi:crossover junction endodeoxyribonuclease RuvC